MKIVSPSFEIMTPVNGMDILKTIESVGRTCYKSEDKITDDSCVKFVQGIISRGHEAVIEHYNITVRLINDRGVSHEEVRHRVASYAQESTRYCNYSKDKFNNQVTYIDLRGGMELDSKVKELSAEDFEAIYSEWVAACEDAERHYNKMIELGATPQIARSVLNNSTKTEICITMNLREWRHFFKLRTAPAAHPQMREAAIPLLKAFQQMIPVVFDDIETQPKSGFIMKKYFRNLEAYIDKDSMDENQFQASRDCVINEMKAQGASQQELNLLQDAMIRNAIRNKRTPVDVAWAVLQ